MPFLSCAQDGDSVRDSSALDSLVQAGILSNPLFAWTGFCDVIPSQKALEEFLWGYEDDEFFSDTSDDDSEVDQDYVQPSSASSSREESFYTSPYKNSNWKTSMT